MRQQKITNLSQLALNAGFDNLHSLGSQCKHLMGSVMSDKFEIIYLRESETETVPPTMEVLGVVNPHEPKTCALYRLEETELRKYSDKGGINIDKQTPFYTGSAVVGILERLAKANKSSRTH